MSKEGIYGLSLGLASIAGAVLQGMYPLISPFIGWPIVGILGIGAIALVIIGIRKKEHIKEVDNQIEGKENKKEQAIKIHNNLLQLEKALWLAKDSVPQGENTLENKEVKNAMANIQAETNKLATLINNGDFEEVIKALLSIYTRYLKYHMNPYSNPGTLNGGHSHIRWYINHKVKG